MLALGLGVKVSENIRYQNSDLFQKNDPSVALVPFIVFRNKHWEIHPYKLKYSFIKHPIGSISTSFRYRGDSYNSDNMDKRRKSITYGGSARFLLFKAEYFKDIQGVHNGSIATYSFTPYIPFSKSVILSFQIGTTYYDSNYMNYYFGVKDSEESEKFPIYSPGKSKVDFIKSYLFIAYGNNQRLRIQTSYYRFNKEIINSPTVNKTKQLEVTMALIYIL